MKAVGSSAAIENGDQVLSLPWSASAPATLAFIAP